MQQFHHTIAVVLACALLGALPAQAKPLTALGLLGQVPGVPRDAQAAYGMWQHNPDGSIKKDEKGNALPAGALKTAEDGIVSMTVPSKAEQESEMTDAEAQMNSPQMQQQKAMAEQMRAKYGTPEGQAQLRNMSPEQMMAMAQQMQGQQGNTARAISPHDQKLVKHIHPYGKNNAELSHSDVLNRFIRMEDKWNTEQSALANEMEKQIEALPDNCFPGGDFAMADPKQEGAIRLSHANKIIALANSYLPKFLALQQEAHKLYLPMVESGDESMDAWSKLEDPVLKSQLSATAKGSQRLGVSEGVGAVETIVKDTSLNAAEAIALKKKVEKDFAHASCK